MTSAPVAKAKPVRTGRVLLLIALSALTAHTFGAYPGWQTIDEVWNVVCALYLIFAVPWWSLRPERRPSGFEYYMLALVAIYPIWIAYCTRQSFGQPLIYGLLAERTTVIIACPLMLMHGLRKGFFSLHEVERALLAFVWVLWAIYIGMRMLMNPANYADYVGFALDVSPYPAAFMLQSEWIMFGAMYYAFRSLRTKRWRNYLLALILLVGITQLYGNRTQTVALVLTILLFACRWAGLKRSFVILPQLLTAIGIVVALAYYLAPAATANRLQTFSDAANAISGEVSDDPSANTHLAELLYVFPQIADRPFWGSGRLSRQWDGGEQSVRGLLFYPDDNGIFGIVYEGGILGLLLFATQYSFAIGAIRKLKPDPTNALLDASNGFLVYAVFTSLFYFQAALTLFFIVLLLQMTWAPDALERRSERLHLQPLAHARTGESFASL